MDGRLASSWAGTGTHPQRGTSRTQRYCRNASGNLAWSRHSNGIKGGFWTEAISGLDEEVAKRRKRIEPEPGHSMPDGDAGLNNILQAAVSLGQQLEIFCIPYCVIGGVAVQRWGEPRQTVDVDATLLTGFGCEESAIVRLLSQFDSRIENPQEFALQNRILLLKSPKGTDIDLSFGALPFEERLIERSSEWRVPRHGMIRTCSAEDLVVLKAFASRPQDWIDVEKVIIRQGQRLNRHLIVEELTPLAELKEDPELLEHLQSLLLKHP